jgi:DNA-binding NarL/FixJ family response regulator
MMTPTMAAAVLAPEPVALARPPRAAPNEARELAPCVLAVDGRPLFRAGLARIARSALGAGALAVADLEAAAVAVRRMPQPPRTLLLGLQAGDDAVTLVARARRLAPQVVCVLDPADRALGTAARAAGADGYLSSRDAGAERLAAALATVEYGESPDTEPLGAGDGSTANPHAALITARCQEVLAALADGLHDHEIGDRLGISTSSVRKHVANAQERLDARTRVQAVAIAASRGLL